MAQFRRPHIPDVWARRVRILMGADARASSRSARGNRIEPAESNLKVRQEGKGVKQTEERERLHGPGSISS